MNGVATEHPAHQLHVGSASPLDECTVMNVGIQDEWCGDGTSCPPAARGKRLAADSLPAGQPRLNQPAQAAHQGKFLFHKIFFFPLLANDIKSRTVKTY